MSFATPVALAALGLIPAIAAFQALRVRKRSKHAVLFTNVRVLEGSVEATVPWARRASAAMFLVALALLAIGAARPRRVLSIPRDRAAVILAMDTSGSMISPDVRPSRGQAATEAALLFIKLVPSTVRIGVVRFATHVQVAAAMSTDRDDARGGVGGWFPNGGSALGDAIDESLRLDPYRRLAPEDRGREPPTVIVVLSDGSNSFSDIDPVAAARKARDQGVPIHAVTIGPPEGERLDNALEVDPPNHKLMQRIAEISGGKYYSAPSSGDLREIYASIATSFFTSEKKQDITVVFVGAALVLLMVGAGLSVFRAGRFP
ncbi:MAG: VWA domain-containing protein [Actinobacteria bacterium]|nr:VWA domain-containing protein [Actinomycetota bacterium]